MSTMRVHLQVSYTWSEASIHEAAPCSIAVLWICQHGWQQFL